LTEDQEPQRVGDRQVEHGLYEEFIDVVLLAMSGYSLVQKVVGGYKNSKRRLFRKQTMAMYPDLQNWRQQRLTMAARRLRRNSERSDSI
jgi:hypothetical protein